MVAKLKVLCCNPDGGAFLYITRGWEDAFKALGHQFERWKGDEAHIRSYQPHIYLGCSGWRQVFPQWARKEYGTKIGIHVNPWGPTVLQALPGEPNINETPEAIKWTLSQRPDFVFCYGGQHDIDGMWGNWKTKAGIQVVPMPTGGNAEAHYPVSPDPKFECDVGFIGGYWPYKAMNIDKYLMPVLNDNRLTGQIYGWGGWSHTKYKGPIQDKDVNILFSSARVCPAICEPHTIRYGIDIPERMFKVPLGGGFTICDPAVNLNKYIDYNVFPTARNPSEYLDLAIYYSRNHDQREALKKQQRVAILEKHTYFSRIQGFLCQSGYYAQADAAQQYVNELVARAQ